MNVYILYTQYTEFEDLDNNYTEIWNVFDDKQKAYKEAYKYFIQEIELGMECENFIYDENMSVASLKQAIKHQLDKFGYISFKQIFGYGKAILGVERKEVK